ncbi:MAG: alpha/beta fold hydrolase [Hyphomicrobiaceae bacterium]
MPLAELNNHEMYYEVHGTGEPVVCSGGWGTYCHGAERHLPQGLTERYSVVIFDHRGLGQSGDEYDRPANTELYANDVIALLKHLSIERAHFLGLIGIGACIGQVVAIKRPDMVRSLVNTGCWAQVDDFFRAQMLQWQQVHHELGFDAFQQMVVQQAFSPDFYNAKKDRLLGPQGGWSELRDNVGTHDRLTEAGIAHDTLDRLADIKAPTLVIHNGRDFITAPRLTLPVEHGIRGAEGIMLDNASHVPTDREDREAFRHGILDFLGRN